MVVQDRVALRRKGCLPQHCNGITGTRFLQFKGELAEILTQQRPTRNRVPDVLETGFFNAVSATLYSRSICCCYGAWTVSAYPL